MRTTVSEGRWFRFTRAPLILQAYVAFALVASAVFFSTFFPAVSAAVIPYMGWSGLSFYLFTLYFALAAILTPQRKAVYGVVAILSVAVLFGAFETFQHIWGAGAGRPDFGNPYLTYHPSRPVFTIVFPVAWLSLLISPVMRKWVNSPSSTLAGCPEHI